VSVLRSLDCGYSVALRDTVYATLQKSHQHVHKHIYIYTVARLQVTGDAAAIAVAIARQVSIITTPFEQPLDRYEHASTYECGVMMSATDRTPHICTSPSASVLRLCSTAQIQ
jgi:hypothetical protein